MLRNLTSENQQLREQNQFMRNLYCNYKNPQTLTVPAPLVLTPTSTRFYKEEIGEESFVVDSSPRKKLRTSAEIPESPPESVLENSMSSSSSALNVSFSLSSETETSPSKSPRKYSAHISKLLASPKRMTRSSVIQQNHAYTSPGSNLNHILESPSRRSLRLIEKDPALQTPTSTRSETNFYQTNSLNSHGLSAKSKLSFDEHRYMMMTPESLKTIQPRSAKRSLDAIIHAIDQIEKSWIFGKISVRFFRRSVFDRYFL